MLVGLGIRDGELKIRVWNGGLKKIYVSTRSYADTSGESSAGFLSVQEDVSIIFTVAVEENLPYFVTVFLHDGVSYDSGSRICYNPEGPVKEGPGDITVGPDNNSLHYINNHKILQAGLHRDYFSADGKTLRTVEKYTQVRKNE